MQDEVNEKTMALCIKGGKISAQLLKAALTKLLSEIEKKKQQSKKMGGQNRCKRGKQSIKSLQQSGAQLTNIVVTDNNIKSFDRVARKYGIDYSLKKAEKEGKTEYLVFFKAKDVDVMTAAFKEYTGVSLKKEQRQSIRKKLEQAKERVAKHREITKEKTKDRGRCDEPEKENDRTEQTTAQSPLQPDRRNGMGKESSGGNQWKDAVGRYEKADPAEFSLHYRLLHGGESRMAVPTL